MIWTHNRPASRATGHFQPCFPASRTVSRPVFASKHELYLYRHGKVTDDRLEDASFPSLKFRTLLIPSLACFTRHAPCFCHNNPVFHEGMHTHKDFVLCEQNLMCGSGENPGDMKITYQVDIRNIYISHLRRKSGSNQSVRAHRRLPLAQALT